MNNVKILCIAGSIVLGSILLSGQAFGKAPSDLITLSAPKEPEGQHVSYDIDGSGSYYDSESDTTYYFVKGIVTSYSNHTKTFSLSQHRSTYMVLRRLSKKLKITCVLSSNFLGTY